MQHLPFPELLEALPHCHDNAPPSVICSLFVRELSAIGTKAGCTRHASCACFERMRLISWRHVLFWCVWYGLRSSRTCFYIDASDSLLWLTFTRTQTIPDASEKDVTSRNQTHALKKRTGRMTCAYSWTARAVILSGVRKIETVRKWVTAADRSKDLNHASGCANNCKIFVVALHQIMFLRIFWGKLFAPFESSMHR